MSESLRILVFATTYIDTDERLRLTHQWVALHQALNPDCELLLVDSASPKIWAGDGGCYPEAVRGLDGARLWSFPDNIGHLSRNEPRRDGWGRAFCKGIEIAIAEQFDYVAHIEGDSLFRLRVAPICTRMRHEAIKVASIPVDGTRRKEIGWVETGLMLFDVAYLAESAFIAGYDWPNRKERPTPEAVIFAMLGRDLTMMPWRGARGDKDEITVDNVADYDWITHCAPDVYDAFFVASVREPA